MPSTITLRRKVKSFKNTKQITKAMEKISAVKMKHSQNVALQSRRFAALAWDMVLEFSENVGALTHPLLEEREVKKMGAVVISSDKGLCGSLNAKISYAVISAIAKDGILPEQTFLYAFGRKAREALLRARISLAADFGAMPAHPSASHARPIAEAVVSDFLSGKIDRVYLVYSHFKDTLLQESVARRLLPISRESIQKESESMNKQKGMTIYTFEPSPEEVLEALLLRIVETQIYQALLEHNASEHSARMVAMKNATDNITDLIADVTLIMNQNRQAYITREVSEISAGKAALE